ncbi:MAG: hypothetical protein RMN53_14970 [Anaerolineae bacterium]|nr:hypothetical protein [Anaerolineae bacterium]
MEYFVTIVDPSGRPRKERFGDLGAAASRAAELYQAAQAGQELRPTAITDTGERLLLDQAAIARMAAITAKASPVGDQVAQRVFGALDPAELDELCRWLVFRLRTAGVSGQQRLHVIAAILDAVTPDA